MFSDAAWIFKITQGDSCVYLKFSWYAFWIIYVHDLCFKVRELIFKGGGGGPFVWYKLHDNKFHSRTVKTNVCLYAFQTIFFFFGTGLVSLLIFLHDKWTVKSVFFQNAIVTVTYLLLALYYANFNWFGFLRSMKWKI